MRKLVFQFLWLSLSFLLCLASCDSGDIYPENSETVDGISVDATFRFLHMEAYPKSYDILFGTFNDESDFPIVSKNITKPDDGQMVIISISNIPEGSTSIRLSLSKSGRKTFYTLYEMKLNSKPTEDIVIPEQTINLLQYGRIQEQVFSQCIACHGGSDRVGANLYLTPDKSYSNLVNIQSVKSNKNRVEPSNVSGSFLVDVLIDEQPNLSYQHYMSISSLKDDDITLLKEWIRNDALDN